MKTLVLLLTAFSLVVSPATASNGADDVAWNRYLVLADNSTCLQETQQINTPAFNNLIVAGGEVPAVINGTNTYVVNILKDECIGKQLQNCEADVALARELKGDKLYYVPDLVKELCASGKLLLLVIFPSSQRRRMIPFQPERLALALTRLI